MTVSRPRLHPAEVRDVAAAATKNVNRPEARNLRRARDNGQAFLTSTTGLVTQS